MIASTGRSAIIGGMDGSSAGGVTGGSSAGRTTGGVSTATAKWMLALLVLLNLFNYIDRFNLPPVVTQIQEEFKATGGQMGTLATGFLVIYMLTAPLFGWLADRYSRWALVGVGMIIQSLGTFGSGAATSFTMLMIARCVVGVGDAAYGPAAPTIIADLFPLRVRGRMLSWFYAAIPVGSALGFALGGYMQGLTGTWRWGFYSAVGPMILLGCVCLFIRDRRAGVPQVKPPKLKWADYRLVLTNRSYLFNCLGMTLMTFAIGGISFWMPTYLTADRNLTPSQASIGFGAVVVVAGLSATIFGGWIGDRLKSRFTGSYFLVSGAGMIAGFPLLLAMLYVPFPACWVVIFLAVFALFVNTGPSNAILANVTAPHVRASAFAINIFVIHALGDAISPTYIGYIRDIHGLKIAFILISLTVLASGIAWLAGTRYLAGDEIEAQ